MLRRRLQQRRWRCGKATNGGFLVGREFAIGAFVKLLANPRFLVIYSGVLTFVFAVVVFCAAFAVSNPTFGTITARRINIVEPDGTVRLTISNRADFPGAWNRKKEYPRPAPPKAAGIHFMTDEGTEPAGLTWAAAQRQER